jgi:hypothetical protein
MSRPGHGFLGSNSSIAAKEEHPAEEVVHLERIVAERQEEVFWGVECHLEGRQFRPAVKPVAIHPSVILPNC